MQNSSDWVHARLADLSRNRRRAGWYLTETMDAKDRTGHGRAGMGMRD